jgi:hypothetical protein
MGLVSQCGGARVSADSALGGGRGGGGMGKKKEGCEPGVGGP